jgi:hypothetical protein
MCRRNWHIPVDFPCSPDRKFQMTISPPLDGAGDTAVKPWVLPAAAGVVLAAVVATACVCVFALSAPILPILAVCVPVAAALIGFIVWRILSPKVTPGTNAKTGTQNLGGNTPKGTGANGGGNGVGPTLDAENITNDGQRSNFLAVRTLKFLGCHEGKLSFEGLGADDSSFSFTEESFGVALGECKNVDHLIFDGSVPDNLKIKAESVENLVRLKFINNPDITEFRALTIFDVLPLNLSTVIVNNCGILTSATVIPHLDTHFENCNKLRTIYVGAGPHKPEFTESDSLVVCEIPPSCDEYKTLIVVNNCSSFNPIPNGEKRIREFDLLESGVTILADGTFSLYARHGYGVRNDAADIAVCIFETGPATEIPPAYGSVKLAEILSNPEESEGGVLFRLPGDLSVTEGVKIDYRAKNDAIGKCILDFNQPQQIRLDSATVKHIVLTNRQKSGSKKVTSCEVSYNPSDNSTVEIENFAFPGGNLEIYCAFLNRGGKDVNLPVIKINGKDLNVAWHKNGNFLYPIIQEKSEHFLAKNPDHKLDALGKWHAGECVSIPASWTFLGIE